MEWVKPLGGIGEHAATPVEPAQLDTVDLQLLLLLSQDARISQRSLARELGMSAVHFQHNDQAIGEIRNALDL